MRGTVKFIPVKNGTEIEMGQTGLIGVTGYHVYLGFKPGRTGRAEGWLVFLVRPGSEAPKRVRGKEK